jgi:hypothetical protein
MALEEVGARLSFKDRRQFSADAAKARRDVKDIGDEADRSGRKADRASRGFATLSKGFAGLRLGVGVGITALGALSVAAGVAGSKMLSLGTDAAETASKFGTVFGPATAEVTKFVEATNKSFGIPTKELQDATSTFGVFAKAAKLPQEDLAGFSTSLAQAGLDLSSFYNVASDGADGTFAALRSGLSGEAEPLRKFGIFLSAEMVNARAKTMGFTGALTEAQKVMVRQKLILEGLGDAQGDMARTAGGAANQWRGFRGRLTEAATTIGQSLLPPATALLVWANDKMRPAIEWLQANAARTVERFGDALARAWKQADKLFGAFRSGDVGGIAASIDTMFGGTGTLVGPIESLVSVAQDLGRVFTGAIVPAFTDLMSVVPDLLQPVKLLGSALGVAADHASLLHPPLVGITTSLVVWKTGALLLGVGKGVRFLAWAFLYLKLAMAAHPILFWAGVIAGVAAALVAAYNKSETFRDVVTGVFGAVAGVAQAVFGWFSRNWPLLLAILTGPFGLAVLAIARNWDTIKEGVSKAKDWIVSAFKTVADVITAPFRFLVDTIEKVVRLAKEAIGLVDKIPGAGLVKGAAGAVGKVGGAVGGLIGKLPGLHQGGAITRGGWAVTGERGPELGFWPTGSAVVPAQTTAIPERFAQLTMDPAPPPPTGTNELVINNVMEVDGEVLWRSTKRYARRDLARQ